VGKARIYAVHLLRHSSAHGEPSYAEGRILKTTFPVQLGTAMLEGLAAALDGTRVQTFERGMAALRNSVPFDGAWWGLIEGPDVVVAPSFHLAGSIGLSDALRQEYAEICGDDSFAAAVAQHPGRVLRWSGTDDAVAQIVQDWVKRHQLAHGAAMCSHEVFSGQSFVVVLYRFDGVEAFSDDEATMMQFLLGQLGLLWSKSLKEMFNATTAEALSGTLLSKPDGTLLYCGSDMAIRLAAVGLDQQGQRVPPIFLQFASVGGRVRVGKDWVVVSLDDEGLRAQLASNEQSHPLPSRLLRVAALSCEGLTAKEIARELALSPATVRTYLRDAYGQLGVRNKLELHSAMRRGVS
jgi:DNA-binding CsgD family transcriptional regulator